MPGVIAVATPGLLFIKGPIYPEDLAEALAERGFYVFGQPINQVGQCGEGSSPPTAQLVALPGDRVTDAPR